MHLTPYEIHVLLWHHHFPKQMYPCAGETTYMNTIRKLNAELLIHRRMEDGLTFITTSRAEVYLEALTRMPLPMQQWVAPEVPA